MFGRLWLVTVSVTLSSTACNRTVPTYPTLDGVTRVEVHVRAAGRDSTIESIVDPDAVARITAFVNARRDGWEVPWFGVPVPTTEAYFYRGPQFLGHVGAGATFLETQRLDTFASRPASAEEVAAFNALLGIGTKVIAVPAQRD